MLPEEIQAILSQLPTEYHRMVWVYGFGNQILEARVQELKDSLSENSRNSKIPESRRLCKKSGWNAGEQKGYEGNTLKMVENSDDVVYPVKFCVCCTWRDGYSWSSTAENIGH